MVIDECHRGSACEDAAWHEILTYFTSAVHIGLTATPKETKEVSNIHYFGDPLYTYSLRQGIADGFLAPYKVVRVDIDKDLFGWRPPRGKVDKHGQLVEDRIYNQGDMDRVLVLEQRTQLVARRITEFLKGSDRRRTLTKTYASLDDFLDTWTQAGKKKLVMDELEQQSVLWESYSKTKPIRIQEFDLEKEWWGGAERKGREETGHAWRVPVSEIKANNYNLDIKNPHNADEGPGDPDTLLAQMRSLQTDIDGIRDQLKADLAAALEHHA